MTQNDRNGSVASGARRGLGAVMTLVVLAAVVLAVGAWRPSPQAGDEPPIRVKNGSMHITLDSGSWADNGDAWSPSGGGNSGGYDVKVQCGSGASCANGAKASGNLVRVVFSDGFTVTFTPSGRTLIRPKSQLTKVSDSLLRYGTPGSGYVQKVEVLGGGRPFLCTFNSANALTEITICKAGGSACQ